MEACSKSINVSESILQHPLVGSIFGRAAFREIRKELKKAAGPQIKAACTML